MRCQQQVQPVLHVVLLFCIDVASAYQLRKCCAASCIAHVSVMLLVCEVYAHVFLYL